MALIDYLPVGEEVPQAIAGVILLALAVVVLRVAFASRLNRAFALYLCLAGFSIFWGALDDTPAIAGLAMAMWPYFGLASPAALVYLALRFREHHDRTRVPAWIGWTLLAWAVTLVALYALDHALLRAPGDGMGPAGHGNLLWGPLYPLSYSGIGILLAAALAYGFARRARTSQEPAKIGFVLAATAFLIVTAFEATYAVARFVPELLRTGSIPGTVWFHLALVPRTASLIFTAAAAFELYRQKHHLSTGLAVASAASAIGVALTVRAGVGWTFNVVDGLWDLMQAALLAYAVLKGQLLHLDAKFRFAISRSSIAAAFIAAFFIASETAQQFFGETLGSTYVGIAAAGALVFALAPLQRVAERLAEKAVPQAASTGAAPALASRREAVFLAAARLALRGGLTRDEEVQLAELAEELGIGAGRAAALLREAEREAAATVVLGTKGAA